MKDFLRKFDNGAILPDEVARGMHLSYKNAVRLRREAKVLSLFGASDRAMALAVLALEELGRIPLLLNAVFLEQNDTEGWKLFWRKLRSHGHKQSVWSHYGKILQREGIPDAENYRDRYPPGTEPLLDRFKQCGFYVSFFEGKFLDPRQFSSDNRKWFWYLLAAVKKRLKSLEKMHGKLEYSQRLVRISLGLLRSSERNPELKRALDEIRNVVRTPD